MEEEIDLRPYLEALLRNWMWIVGTAVLAALLAFGLSSLVPSTYEATALIAVTEPRERLQFDSRIETVPDNNPLKAYPELATSDDILQALLAQIAPTTDDIKTLAALRGRVEAKSGSDLSLIRLSARHSNPAKVSEITNAWAEIFVARANKIYSGQGEEQIRFFESQLEQARLELETAEQSLVDFQARNRLTLVSNQLDFYSQTQADYLASQRAVTVLRQDVQRLYDQLIAQSDSRSTTFADQLTLLLLQIKAFDSRFSTNAAAAESTIPLQLQINGTESLTGAGRSEQLAFLTSLIRTLEEKAAQVETELAELEPQILALQGQRQEVEIETDRLIRDRDLAQETYIALARKVDQERITSQDNTSGVLLASRAAVPVQPVSPRRLLNTAAAGALGLLISFSTVLVMVWWRGAKILTPTTSSSGRQPRVTVDEGHHQPGLSES